MTTRRRLFAVLAAGALALVGLAGCRSDPTVAAYVGKAQLTEAQVEEIVGSIPDLPQERVGDARQYTVSMFILREAGTAYARDKGITIPAADVAGMAERSGLPADSGYTRLLAEFDAVMRALGERVRPAAPSEADQREAYANLQLREQAPPFDQVRQLFTTETMGPGVGQRNLLTEVVRGVDVTVNPRYAPLTYRVPLQIGGVNTWLGVPLAGEPGTGAAVVDRS